MAGLWERRSTTVPVLLQDPANWGQLFHRTCSCFKCTYVICATDQDWHYDALKRHPRKSISNQCTARWVLLPECVFAPAVTSVSQKVTLSPSWCEDSVTWPEHSSLLDDLNRSRFLPSSLSSFSPHSSSIPTSRWVRVHLSTLKLHGFSPLILAAEA